MQTRIINDFETRSRVELKKVGAYKYSVHPSTQPTCLSFKLSNEDKVYFLPFEQINSQWCRLPWEVRKAWTTAIHTEVLFTAHNDFFEKCIYNNILVKRYGWPKVPARRRRCTAAKAAACALPRSLEGVGEALQLRTQKDKRGHAAVMATCKPTKQWNAWNKVQQEVKAGKRVGERKLKLFHSPEPPVFLEPLPMAEIKLIRSGEKRVDEATLKRAHVWGTLYHYCKVDTKSEDEVDKALPDLIPQEQEVWHLNQKMNWRGLRLDIPTIKKIVTIMEEESRVRLKELDELTMGLVTKPGAVKSILEFLEIEGVTLPNMRAKTVDDALNGANLSPSVRELLELRKALAMSSVKKYKAFLDRAMEDDHRARDILMYHGASTGRDTGTGLQIQNFPRGLLKNDPQDPYFHVKNVIECDTHELKLIYGDNLSMLFSSILRNMILPSKGKLIYAGDFSKIEVAVLWWLADNKPGLKILRDGEDPYIHQAVANTKKTYNEISEDERQLGKAQILGGGFGMGAPKFQTTAWDMYRLKLTLKESVIAIKNYRETHEAVPKLWKAYENAAIEAIDNKGRVVKAGKCKFFVKNKFLWIELPSGRRLAYREPKIAWRVNQYQKVVTKVINGKEKTFLKTETSEPKKTVEFMAVNSKTKKWSRERTFGGSITENIVQAVARDIMKEAELRLEASGYLMLFPVHDEAVTEHEKGNVAEFRKIMMQTPKWADKHLPIDVKAWAGCRYRK